MDNKSTHIQDNSPVKSALVSAACLLVFVILAWVQIELSCRFLMPGVQWYNFKIEPAYAMLSIATLYAFSALLYAITANVGVSGIILVLLSTTLSIINYFVIKYHGSPVSFLLINQFATALNVASSYSFAPTKHVVALFIMGVVGIAFGVKLARKTAHPQAATRHASDTSKQMWEGVALPALVPRIAALLVATLLLVLGYQSPVAPTIRGLFMWNWAETYEPYGFIPCTAHSLYALNHLLSEPYGYSQEALATIELPAAVEASMQPDIILILNETFSDPSLYINGLQTDRDYLDYINSLPNAIHGYSVVPDAGGGTNESEFELLTSNTTMLFGTPLAPYMSLSMENIPSLVSVLEAQGYESTSLHPEKSVNYNRGIAYKELGFDHSLFHKDMHLQYVGERNFPTDASLYKNLISVYEENQVANKQQGIDKPQFMFCLTIQNHGGWNQKNPSFEPVHAQNMPEAYAGKMDEFLSCINESDRAFKELVEYFSQVDRPVIVCMMGDHCPSFAAELGQAVGYAEGCDYYTELRATPLVLWANYKLETRDVDRISIFYVGPLLLHEAHVAVPPFYGYLYELMYNYPVLTRMGTYSDGKQGYVELGKGTPKELYGYLYMSYANISGNSYAPAYEL